MKNKMRPGQSCHYVAVCMSCILWTIIHFITLHVHNFCMYRKLLVVRILSNQFKPISDPHPLARIVFKVKMHKVYMEGYFIRHQT